MTEAETRIVVALHSQGLSVREITQERPTFSYGDVYCCLEENGLDPMENIKFTNYEMAYLKQEVKTMDTNKKKSNTPIFDAIKAKAIELHQAGMTQAKIAEELSIGTASVYRILKAAKQTATEQPTAEEAEEKEPAPVAAETSSEPDWATLTVETAETPLTPITNYTADKEFCQGLLDDIDTAIKMLLESVFGSEDIYSSEKTAFAIGGAVRKLQDAYNKLEEVIYENN